MMVARESPIPIDAYPKDMTAATIDSQDSL